MTGPRLDRHDRGHADLQAAGFELRDAGLQLHLVDVGDDDHALAIAGADERALIEVAFDNDPGRGSGERRVAADFLGAPE